MKLSALVSNANQVVEDAKETIKEVYLAHNKPWVIGYSGGKDSTATLHVVLDTLKELPKEQLTNHVYVISSDTMVETPLIINEITTNLDLIQRMGEEYGLPITTRKVKPEDEETFWSNMIGKGYPAPNQSFRWCTDRLKINPTNKFITDLVSSFGEVIVVLGVRSGESNSRDRVLEKRSIESSVLMRHSTLSNAYVFPPIKAFTVDDVWNLLLNNPSPWGGDSARLFQLYSESQDSSECPLVIDKSTKDSAGSCGNSRFGCWVCTVVKEDKSLTGFIKNGYQWLNPLLEYRNWLVEIRDDRSMRMKIRINGQIYFVKVNEKGNEIIIPAKNSREKVVINKDTMIDQKGVQWLLFENKKDTIEYIKKHSIDLKSEFDPKIIIKTNEGYNILGTGGYTYNARKEMLKRLFEVEKKLSISQNTVVKLITEAELLHIQKLWHDQGHWQNDVASIFYEVHQRQLRIIGEDTSFLDSDALLLLDKICTEEMVDLALIKKLVMLEGNNYGLRRREVVLKEMKKMLSSDYTNL